MKAGADREATMRERLWSFSTGVALGGLSLALTHAAVPATRSLNPSQLSRIATVDERFQSYNVEMAEVIGGNFWKPYGASPSVPSKATPASSAGSGGQAAGVDPSLFEARPPIDLLNPRLRRLAAALGPAYMRTSGTWANMVYFQDSGAPPPSTAPEGFQGVLTRAEWKGVIDFAAAANAKLVSSFTISRGVRDASAAWTPVQAARLVEFTKSVGGEFAAAEFFNEPNMPAFGGAPAGYTAADYARDFAIFRTFARAAVPQMQIVGPGSVGEGTLMNAMPSTPMSAGFVATEQMLSAQPKPVFDIFSYHHYGAASQRCAPMGAAAQTTADAALTEEWLARTDRSYDFYVALRDRFEPRTPLWITETADSACGGNPWATTFLDTFRYVDQLGRLAKRGVSVIFHNTLASSEYGLLDQNTFAPRPNYWAALLWHRLMGTTVLDAGSIGADLHVYAHCSSTGQGGVTILAINKNRTTPQSIELPKPADRYTFSAKALDFTDVELNGKTLRLQVGDAIPDIPPIRQPAGQVSVAPATITFLSIPSAANNTCR
jgi:heparanase